MTRYLHTLAVVFLVVTAGCSAIPQPTSPDTSPVQDPASGDGISVTVVRVIDGDTMDIRYENGSTERVRLLGVDTPETHTGVSPEEWEGVPDSPTGRDCLETWGDRASQYATDELAGQTVTLVLDPESDSRGSYGRLLGYLVYDGQSFNERLIETGHARMYDSEFSQRSEFAQMEETAMTNGTGAWTCRDPTTGGTENSDAPIAISVHADAAGDDRDNLNDEYVTITNTGNTTLNVTEWTISDAADHTYTFQERTIDPGASLVLNTGSGSANETHVYWGASQPIWNNDGDTVTVANSTGATVAETTY